MKGEVSVWLYGSFARGDADAESDIDILVVADERVDWRNFALSDAFLGPSVLASYQVSTMEFRWRELDAMAAYGSLFLHHIRLEGRPLSGMRDDRLLAVLKSLPPYRRAGQEIRAFRTVLQDVEQSLSRDHSPAFELAVLGTALRHAFILGCYVTGQPDFGRTSPFTKLSSELGLSAEASRRFTSLYQFRLYQQNRAPEPFRPTSRDVREWLRRAGRILDAVEERVDDFERTMH